MSSGRTNGSAIGEIGSCGGGLKPHGHAGWFALLSRLANHDAMLCRAGCGACCIAPSISSPIPGMPNGKPAGVRCVQLMPDNHCAIFGKPERPAVCVKLRPMQEMCGDTYEQAFAYLTW